MSACARHINSICTGDDDLADTGLNSGEGILQFGKHTTGHDTLFDQSGKLGGPDGGNYTVVIVSIPEHTLLLETVHQRNVEIAGHRLCRRQWCRRWY